MKLQLANNSLVVGEIIENYDKVIVFLKKGMDEATKAGDVMTQMTEESELAEWSIPIL